MHERATRESARAAAPRRRPSRYSCCRALRPRRRAACPTRRTRLRRAARRNRSASSATSVDTPRRRSARASAPGRVKLSGLEAEPLGERAGVDATHLARVARRAASSRASVAEARRGGSTASAGRRDASLARRAASPREAARARAAPRTPDARAAACVGAPRYRVRSDSSVSVRAVSADASAARRDVHVRRVRRRRLRSGACPD